MSRSRGFTLVELLVSLALGAVVLTGLTALVEAANRVEAVALSRARLAEAGTFALRRIERAAQRSAGLLLPFPDDPGTTWREHVREEFVPAAAPESGSTKATAVLALRTDPSLDLDADGTPDADNDGDGQVDEDPGSDRSNDGAPGIHGIDDTGNGPVDENAWFGYNDDEDGSHFDEDKINGLDDDGDGRIDEDPGGDNYDDSCPGRCGVDDDLDGSIDEGFFADNDDDEDGRRDEDWIDVIVFHLSGDRLQMRLPVPWDESGNGSLSGRDYVTATLAEGVTHFRVERLVPTLSARATLVAISLTLADPHGESVTLSTQVRVGR